MNTDSLLPAPARDAPANALTAAAGAGAVIVAGVVAVHSTHLLIQVALAALLTVVIFRWPLAAVAVFIFLTFPQRLPGWVGAGGTVAKPFGLLLIVSWLLLLLRDRLRPVLPRDRPLLSALLVGYVAWAAISLVWTVNTGVTQSNLGRLVPLVLLTPVVYSIAGSGREIAVLVRAYVFTSALWSAYALATGTTVAGNRLTGGLNDPNYFATELVFAILAGGFLLGRTRGLVGRTLLLAALGVDLLAFVLTQSRGGIIGLAVGLLAAIVVAGRQRGLVLGAVVIAVAAVVTYVAIIAPATVRHRVTDFSATQSSGRTDSWHIAYRIWANHPLNGVGLGGFRDAQVSYVSSVNLQFVGQILNARLITHNTYLETLSELGLVGIGFLGGAIVLLFAWAFMAQLKVRAPRTEGDTYVLRGLIAGTVGLFAAFIFVSAEYEKSLWIAVALLAAATRTVVANNREQLAEQAKPKPRARARRRRLSSAGRPVPR
jgi:O-antigen ligase